MLKLPGSFCLFGLGGGGIVDELPKIGGSNF